MSTKGEAGGVPTRQRFGEWELHDDSGEPYLSRPTIDIVMPHQICAATAPATGRVLIPEDDGNLVPVEAVRALDEANRKYLASKAVRR